MYKFSFITSYVHRDVEKGLQKNAQMVEELVESGLSPEYLELFLDEYTKSINRNIIIIDDSCNILIHSVVTERFDNSIKSVPKRFCIDVLSRETSIKKGTLGGVYSSNMYTLQIPVVRGKDEKVLGAVMISMPFPEMRNIEIEIFKISAISMLIVIIITFILSFMLSKRLSLPIKQINNIAKKFGKRNFKERIDIKENTYNIKEMKELADSFNNMAQELEKSEEIRNNFVSDVSHELRTPMTTIGGFVDGILDGTIPKDMQESYLKIVKDEVLRLTKLVNKFLDVTRLQSDNLILEYRDFDIAELIRMVIISLETKIKEKNLLVNLKFEYDSMFVYADQDSIKRVITNLLDNAIKFTENGGEIVVSIKKKRQETEISVYNSGFGISDDEKLYIFNRFYKADKSRSENKEGNGIGLFIVKGILSKHGKEIKVKSKEGEFAEFTFCLDNSETANKN